MDRKFARMSLGGVHDEAEIRGHRRTYIGAMPGRIISAINDGQVHEPGHPARRDRQAGGRLQAATLPAPCWRCWTPSRTRTFKDNYLDIPFDLSEVLFITTANDASHDSRPAAMTVWMSSSCPAIPAREKFNIAKRHLLPKQLKNNGLDGTRYHDPGGACMRSSTATPAKPACVTLERTITVGAAQVCSEDRRRGDRKDQRYSGTMVKAAARSREGQADLYLPHRRCWHCQRPGLDQCGRRDAARRSCRHPQRHPARWRSPAAWVM